MSNIVMPPQHLCEFRIEKDGSDARTLIAQTRRTFFVSEFTEAMTRAPEFIIGPKENAVIRVFTCETLGVTGWFETEFFGPKGFEHIKKFGLVPCLSDDAFAVRVAHTAQELNEWIRVAHTHIFVRSCHAMFHVGHNRGFGRHVNGYFLNSDLRLNPGDLVALRVAN